MNQKTIKKAVKVINRNIKFYQSKLIYQLELKLEAEVGNGNLKIANVGDYDESNIQKYEIILADLATIKRAIKKNQTTVEIFGTAENENLIYIELLSVISEAGFDYYDGELHLLFPEDEKEREREEEQTTMLFNALMAEYDDEE